MPSFILLYHELRCNSQRNLGNTCYVNSYLQIWYHNQTFRQAIYDWEDREEGEVGEEDRDKVASLQVLFASMQFSNRRYVDPSNFIRTLGLNPQIQQDAQEFSTLFLSLLESALSQQAKLSVRTMVQSQFREGL